MSDEMVVLLVFFCLIVVNFITAICMHYIPAGKDRLETVMSHDSIFVKVLDYIVMILAGFTFWPLWGLSSLMQWIQKRKEEKRK